MNNLISAYSMILNYYCHHFFYLHNYYMNQMILRYQLMNMDLYAGLVELHFSMKLTSWLFVQTILLLSYYPINLFLTFKALLDSSL